MSNTSAPVPWTREHKDHLIGKEVLIVHGPKKGRVGEVRELGGDIATVFFAGSQGNRIRTKYEDAILMTNGLFLNGLVPNEEALKIWRATNKTLTRAPPVREPTPPPLSPPHASSSNEIDPAWDPSHHVDGEGESTHEPSYDGEGEFLLNPKLWEKLGHRHICVQFNAGYENGRWIKRIARTELNRMAGPGEVALVWTDNRALSRKANVPVKYLLPAVPRARGCQAIVLKGLRAGELVTIDKCKKKEQKLVLQVDMERRKWEVDEGDVCWVDTPKI